VSFEASAEKGKLTTVNSFPAELHADAVLSYSRGIISCYTKSAITRTCKSDLVGYLCHCTTSVWLKKKKKKTKFVKAP